MKSSPWQFLHPSAHCLTWELKRSADSSLDLSGLRWDAGQPLLCLSSASLCRGLEASPPISAVALTCLLLYPLHVLEFRFSSDTGEKPVQSKTLAWPGVGWEQGYGACQGSRLLWTKPGLHLFELLWLLVEAQPSPSAPELTLWNLDGLSHAPAGSEAACCSEPLLITALTWLL